MTPKLTEYLRKLVASFVARDAGEIDKEDDMLAELDKLWLSMSADEKENSRKVAQFAKFTHEINQTHRCAVETSTVFVIAHSQLNIGNTLQSGWLDPNCRFVQTKQRHDFFHGSNHTNRFTENRLHQDWQIASPGSMALN